MSDWHETGKRISIAAVMNEAVGGVWSTEELTALKTDLYNRMLARRAELAQTLRAGLGTRRPEVIRSMYVQAFPEFQELERKLPRAVVLESDDDINAWFTSLGWL